MRSTDSWLATFKAHRRVDPTPWQTLVTRGESFLADHPVAQLVASAGVLASAGIAVCILFSAVGG